MDISYTFIKHWKGLGDEQSHDPINQFFYYFVAFNCLYENVFTGTCLNRGRASDLEKISVFRQSEIYEQCKNNGFKPCEDLTKIPNLAKGVERKKEDVALNSDRKIFIGDTIERQEANLLKNIYQVRCNLFHGQKEILNEEGRNFALVKESADVLRDLLTAFLK